MSDVDKAKAADVAVVFTACEKLLLHLAAVIHNAQHEEEEEEEEEVKTRTAKREACQKLALDITREILRNHIRYLMMLLSPSNSGHQSGSSLRLLTAMVATSTVTAKEVLLKLDFEHNSMELLLSRKALRKDYIKFILAFFLVSSPTVIKDFLDKKNRLVNLFPGLMYDSCETVELMMVTLKSHLIENPSVSKTSKMKLLSVFHLKPIVALFGWKGPKGAKGKKNGAGGLATNSFFYVMFVYQIIYLFAWRSNQ